MGQKHLFPALGAQYPSGYIIAGRFTCDGANAPSTFFPIRGSKFKVSAPTVGRYIVTLDDGPLTQLISGFAELIDPAANSTKRAFLASVFELDIDGTFQIQTQSASGTDANLASPATVAFALFVSESRALTR